MTHFHLTLIDIHRFFLSSHTHLQLLLDIERHRMCIVWHRFRAAYHSRLKCHIVLTDQRIIVWRKCCGRGHLLRVVCCQRMLGEIDTLIFSLSVGATCRRWWGFAAIIIKIFRWMGWWYAITFGECLSTSGGWINREWRCLVWDTWHSMHIVGMWYSTSTRSNDYEKQRKENKTHNQLSRNRLTHSRNFT